VDESVLLRDCGVWTKRDLDDARRDRFERRTQGGHEALPGEARTDPRLAIGPLGIACRLRHFAMVPE
jgi:hypothetical protein